MRKKKKQPQFVVPFYYKPVLWFCLTCLFIGFILVLQWDHRFSVPIAVFLSVSSIICLLGLSWSLGRDQKLKHQPLEVLGHSIEEYSDGVLITDADGRFEYSNTAFEKLLEIKEGLVISMQLRNIIDFVKHS